MLVPGDKNLLTDIVYIVFELVIALLAIFGNVLVCWAVYLNSNLQNVTNYFVASLAVADIAVGVLAIPFAITISTGFCAFFYGCLFIACFVLVLTQSSIFSLLAIAIDRIIAIRIPLRYNALVTNSRAKGVIAICWFLSFMIGLTPMLGWHRKTLEENGQSENRTNCSSNMVHCFFATVVTMDYMVYYNFFACVLVPLLLMFGIYLKIFMTARQQLKQMENKMMHGERSRYILQKEVHAAKSLAFIVGMFAICWLPLHLINCFTLFCPTCKDPPPGVMYLAIVLSHANSVVNPLIYAYQIREFRCTFRRIIQQHILCRKQGFTSATASRRTSAHDGETENTTVQISKYSLEFYSSRDFRGIHGGGSGGESICMEWTPNQNGLAGEVNGHLVLSCKNGELQKNGTA